VSYSTCRTNEKKIKEDILGYFHQRTKDHQKDESAQVVLSFFILLPLFKTSILLLLCHFRESIQRRISSQETDIHQKAEAHHPKKIDPEFAVTRQWLNVAPQSAIKCYCQFESALNDLRTRGYRGLSLFARNALRRFKPVRKQYDPIKRGGKLLRVFRGNPDWHLSCGQDDA